VVHGKAAAKLVCGVIAAARDSGSCRDRKSRGGAVLLAGHASLRGSGIGDGERKSRRTSAHRKGLPVTMWGKCKGDSGSGRLATLREVPQERFDIDTERLESEFRP